MCLNCVSSIGIADFSFSSLPLLASLSDMLEANYWRAIEIKSLWDEIWDTFFNFNGGTLLSGKVLYSTLCQIGIGIAIVTIIWIFFDTYDKTKLGQPASWHTILVAVLIPAFVIAMLSNNGRLAAATTYSFRGLINQFNEAVLENTFLFVNLSESFRALQSAMVLDGTISNEIKACDVLTGTEQTACLSVAYQNIQVELEKYKDVINNDQLKTYLTSLLSGNGFIKATQDSGLELPLISLIPSWEEIFFAISSTVMIAYQHSLELALIGSSWVLPIVLGATCFPGPIAERAIFGWLVSFFSVGMAKIFFNLAVGFAAHVAMNAIAIDAGFFKLPMYIFICLFAPVISAGLAAGGGVALYRSSTSSIASATSALGNIATMFL